MNHVCDVHFYACTMHEKFGDYTYTITLQGICHILYTVRMCILFTLPAVKSIHNIDIIETKIVRFDVSESLSILRYDHIIMTLPCKKPVYLEKRLQKFQALLQRVVR